MGASALSSVDGRQNPPTAMSRPLIELRGISKSVTGTRALQQVDFSIASGEIVAVVGENAAGKSTLLKILGGILTPYEGDIWIDNQRVELHSVRASNRLGIRLIHQEV